MNNKKDKVNKLIAVLKLMLLFGIMIAIPVYLFVFQKDISMLIDLKQCFCT